MGKVHEIKMCVMPNEQYESYDKVEEVVRLLAEKAWSIGLASADQTLNDGGLGEDYYGYKQYEKFGTHAGKALDHESEECINRLIALGEEVLRDEFTKEEDES